MEAILRLTVPQGIANAHTAQKRYEEVLREMNAVFPSLILQDIESLGVMGEAIEVTPLEPEHLSWLQARGNGWTLRTFSYEEGTPNKVTPHPGESK